MRILLTTDTYHPHKNGSSSFNQRLAAGLAARGHDVTVIAPALHARMEERTLEGVRVIGARSYPLLSYGYRYAPPFFLRGVLAPLIDQFRPDIGHFSSHFSPNTVVLPLLRAREIPTVGSNHFLPDNLLPYLHLPSAFLPPMRSLFWRPWRRIYEQFDAVTAPSRTAVDLMRPHARMRRLEVISNGIDTRRFRPDIDPTPLRERLGLPSDRPLLLFVGRLDREKHVSVLLHAMARLPQSVPGQLLIAGRGSDEPHLFALAEELHLHGRVRFLGFVADDDLPSLYALSTAFIIASVAELQSIATLEAMATGKPVIAAASLALPELVHDGENGYLFPPDDAAALAERIALLLADPARLRSMGEHASTMAQSHSLERTLDRFEELYKELIVSSGRTTP